MSLHSKPECHGTSYEEIISDVKRCSWEHCIALSINEYSYYSYIGTLYGVNCGHPSERKIPYNSVVNFTLFIYYWSRPTLSFKSKIISLELNSSRSNITVCCLNADVSNYLCQYI